MQVVSSVHSINGGDITHIGGSTFCHVLSGKVAFGYAEIYKSDLPNDGADKITAAELSFYIDSLNADWSIDQRLIEDTGVTVSFDSNGKAH